MRGYFGGMAPPQGPLPPSTPERRPARRAQTLGEQAASAARAAAAFYRGLRSPAAGADPMQVEQQRRSAAYSSALAAYRSRLAALRARLVVGTGAAVGGAAVAAATVGPPDGDAAWLVVGGSTAVIGAWHAVKGTRGLHQLEEPAPPPQLVSRTPPLPEGSPGADPAARVNATRGHIMELLPGLDHLHPEAAEQVRAADAATAPGLNAVVERIRSLQRINAQMPGTEAARAARISTNHLAVQLNEGATTYQELLDGVIALSTSPSLSGGPAATLRPAIEDMHAYAAGLQRAAETWT